MVEWWCKTLGAEYLDFYAIDIKVSDCTFKLKKPFHVKAKDEEQAVKYKFIKPIHVKAKDEEQAVKCKFIIINSIFLYRMMESLFI